MDPNKSLDEVKIIAALLCDIQLLHCEVFSPRAARLTTDKVVNRVAREGLGFLTKTLPRLGKALDRALTGEVPLNSTELAFDSLPGSKLPRFLGELFQCIFSHDGWILPTPCVRSIMSIREICFCYYKYKLPYDTTSEQKVIRQFIKTEEELSVTNKTLSHLADILTSNHTATEAELNVPLPLSYKVIRRARVLLNRVFSSFDPTDIYPSHGPGAVADKATLWDKYTWKAISPRIISHYPLDSYFYASLGHVCDSLDEIQSHEICESSARVILVPKDSRGPRLISCEPLAFQWIQQGLGRAIVNHVERLPLTRYAIHFTDQQPNQFGALLGSSTGKYSTIDLNEASDRVSVGLVRLLFPEHISNVLLSCRTLSTELPGGKVLDLNKFAPMGSALCFPVLALSIWAILTAAAPDAYTRSRILVYGDDVVVPTAYAANAAEQLESFGLKINRDKSCTSGFFRESCGVDAYKGHNVTPVRFRTVWSSSRCPDVYVSYIAYANALYKRHYYNTYELIVRALNHTYGPIPDEAMNLSCPSLIAIPEAHRPTRTRSNPHLQKREWLVWDVKSRLINKEIAGWRMLLRFFSEGCAKSAPYQANVINDVPRRCGVMDFSSNRVPFSVRSYTKRGTVKLVRRWR